MSFTPDSDSSRTLTMSPMRCWLCMAGWRSFLTMLPMMRAPSGRKRIEKTDSSHEMENIATR